MESMWERSRHAFERILEDSRRATHLMVGAFEQLGERAMVRLEWARVQRALLGHCAELGVHIYELSRSAAAAEAQGTSDEIDAAPLRDPKVQALLASIAQLDSEGTKLQDKLAE